MGRQFPESHTDVDFQEKGYYRLTNNFDLSRKKMLRDWPNGSLRKTLRL